MAEENTLVGDLYNPQATATEEDEPESKPTKNVTFYKLFAFADSHYTIRRPLQECAANEEKQLLAKVFGLLPSSSARNKILVQEAVDSLRDSATSRTSKLLQEMSTMQDFTYSIKDEWTTIRILLQWKVERLAWRKDLSNVLLRQDWANNNGQMLRSPC